MILYDFTCPQGHAFEAFARMSDMTTPCPTCGLLAARQIGRPAVFDLRGSGFYANDYGPRAEQGTATPAR